MVKPDDLDATRQIVPTILGDLISGRIPRSRNRVMQALLQMKKLASRRSRRRRRGRRAAREADRAHHSRGRTPRSVSP
jgi:hypothetical protein